MVNQLHVRELAPGEVFVKEEDELKDYYLVADGTLQQVQVGQKVEIKVRH